MRVAGWLARGESAMARRAAHGMAGQELFSRREPAPQGNELSVAPGGAPPRDAGPKSLPALIFRGSPPLPEVPGQKTDA